MIDKLVTYIFRISLFYCIPIIVVMIVLSLVGVELRPVKGKEFNNTQLLVMTVLGIIVSTLIYILFLPSFLKLGHEGFIGPVGY